MTMCHLLLDFGHPMNQNSLITFPFGSVWSPLTYLSLKLLNTPSSPVILSVSLCCLPATQVVHSGYIRAKSQNSYLKYA